MEAVGVRAPLCSRKTVGNAPETAVSTGGSEGEMEEMRSSKQERVVSNADQFSEMLTFEL